MPENQSQTGISAFLMFSQHQTGLKIQSDRQIFSHILYFDPFPEAKYQIFNFQFLSLILWHFGVGGPIFSAPLDMLGEPLFFDT